MLVYEASFTLDARQHPVSFHPTGSPHLSGHFTRLFIADGHARWYGLALIWVPNETGDYDHRDGHCKPFILLAFPKSPTVAPPVEGAHVFRLPDGRSE